MEWYRESDISDAGFSEAAADAFFRANGIARVTMIEALLEAPALFIGRKPLANPRRTISVMTTTGGGGAILTNDAELGRRAKHLTTTAKVPHPYEFVHDEIAANAAQAARASGEPVLMGAPNVVRGGSQSGNIAAEDLVKLGLCDALVSDYYYPALAQAAFALADRGTCDLAQAWRMISTAPARIIGLSDRGEIVQGQRADLVVINAQTRAVEMTVSAGRVAHLAGELAARMVGRAA